MRAIVAAAALSLALAQPARAEMLGTPLLGGADAPSGFVGGLDLFVGAATNSYTRVREGGDRGTYLYLSDDLGIPVIGEVRGLGAWRFDPEDALGVSMGYIFAWGSARLPTNIDYNGGTLQGGTTLSSQPLWFVFELQYERSIFRFGEGDRGYLAADIGLRLDYLHWLFPTATFAPDSPGHEAGEKFLSQMTPVPVLGLSARIPVAADLDVLLGARGFRLNHVSSGRVEGGIIYYSQSLIDATAGLVWTPTPGLQLSFGYRFLYCDIDEESTQDGNLVGLFTHGAYFSLSYAF